MLLKKKTVSELADTFISQLAGIEEEQRNLSSTLTNEIDVLKAKLNVSTREEVKAQTAIANIKKLFGENP